MDINLWKAIKRKSSKGVNEAIRLGADINYVPKGLEFINAPDITRVPFGGTVIHYAIYQKSTDVVRELIKNNADITRRTFDGRTALHVAALNGNVLIAKCLLQNKADVAAVDKSHRQPLYEAAKAGRSDIVKELVEHGADIDAKTTFQARALQVAAREGHLEIVEYLLQNGSDISKPDSEGWSPLYYACERGQLDIVKLLLEKGASVNSKTRNGWTPLHITASIGHIGILSYLIGQENCYLDEVDEHGRSALHLATEEGHIDIVEAITNKLIDVNLKTKNEERSALHLAARRGSVQIVQLLLKAGAGWEGKDTDGFTPMDSATKRGHMPIVSIFFNLHRKRYMEKYVDKEQNRPYEKRHMKDDDATERQKEDLTEAQFKNVNHANIDGQREEMEAKIPDWLPKICKISTDILGNGTYSTVFSGTRHGANVAFKVPKRGGGRLHVSNEIANISMLNHPNIIKILDYFSNRGRTILIMPVASEKTDLGNVIPERKGLPIEYVRNWSKDVAYGIAYLQSQFIVHRDIKPSNVLVFKNKSGEKCLLSDFGSAINLSNREFITDAMYSGTEKYIPPEASDEVCHINSDIYSFGVLTHDMLIGYESLPPNARPAYLESPWKTIVWECLHQDPQERMKIKDVTEKLAALIKIH